VEECHKELVVAEQTQSRIAASVQSATKAALKEELFASTRATSELLHSELGGEEAACKQMKRQLQRCLQQVSELRRESDSHPVTSLQNASSTCSTSDRGNALSSSGGSWRLSTCEGVAYPQEIHQPNDIDAYAELAERLRAEIRWQRTEREASDHALASLRGSYQMLLGRVQRSGEIIPRMAAPAAV